MTRFNFSRSALRAGVALALITGLAVDGTGVADAATPPTGASTQASTTTTSPASELASPTPSAAKSASQSAATVGSTTVGWNMLDESADTLDYWKITGSIHTMTLPDQLPVLPGQGRNYEMGNCDGFCDRQGDVFYYLIGPAGAKVGILDLHFEDLRTAPTMTVTDLNGTAMPNYLDGDEDYATRTWDVMDHPGNGNTAQTLAPGSKAATDALADLCQAHIDSCTFTGTQTQGTVDELLAEAYNPTIEAGTLQTETGYTQSEQTQWSVTGQFGVNFLDVINAGLQGSYTISTTTSHEWSTSYNYPNDPGQTTYIYGRVPALLDTGTFTITLGNTTWTLPDTTVSTPDPTSSTAFEYVPNAVNGDVEYPIASGVHN